MNNKKSTHSPKSEQGRVKQKAIPEKHTCKNCATSFKGKFCPNCGQSVSEFEKPFSFLIVDLAGNIFAFDTRFWKTFISILIRPGAFAREYLGGHRARFMPPIRFYIFVSFIFFVLLSVLINMSLKINTEEQERINNSLSEYEANLDIDSLKGTDKDTLYLDGTFINGNITISNPGKNEMNVLRAIRLINNNPVIYVNRFLKFFSWSLFLMMPFYALLLWLFYHRRRKYYYSHLILAVNEHAFLFIIFILILLGRMIWPGREIYPEIDLLLLYPVYIFVGMKRLYGNSYLVTLLKAFGILFTYAIFFLLAVVFVFFFWFRTEFL